LGMLLVAQPLIHVVFGDNWDEAIPVLQAISIYALMLSLAYNAGDAYKAQGRPEILTRIAFVRVLVLLPGLYWAASQVKSIEMVGWVHAVVAFIFGLVTLVVASRMLHASLRELAVALRPATLAGAAMSLVVMALMTVLRDASHLIQLLATVSTGGVVFMATLWLAERPVIDETIQIIRGALAK
jgi:lipopolysaccharide exporter